MKLLKKASRLTLAVALFPPAIAFAQTYRDTGGTVVPGVVVVDPTDNSGALFSAANPGHVSGSFSASLSGYQPTPSYSYQSVTTTSASYSLPVGAVIIAYK